MGCLTIEAAKDYRFDKATDFGMVFNVFGDVCRFGCFNVVVRKGIFGFAEVSHCNLGGGRHDGGVVLKSSRLDLDSGALSVWGLVAFSNS